MATAISHFNYDPSAPAAGVFAGLYMAAFVITLVQWIKYRAWVWFVMVLGAGMEGVGYIMRIISTKHLEEKSPYVAQFALIVLAPVLMAAGFYVLFGRIVYHVVPARGRTTRLLWIPPRFVTPVFVTGDVICLMLQMIGAIKITSIDPKDPDAKSKADEGRKIALIGVVLQLVIFGFFCIIAVRFNFTSRKYAMDFEKRINAPTDTKYVTIDGQEKKLKKNWQALLRMVNVACLLIFIRTIYRTIDFALGRHGYTENHEWCLYVLDAAMMFPCVAIFTYFHPAKYLPYLSFRIPKDARQAESGHMEMGSV